MCRSEAARAPLLAGLVLAFTCALPQGSIAQTRSQSASPAKSAPAWPGIGRAATPDEIRAWDIDVRPDFKGLPKGAGSVAKGQDVWEAKCASCHGVFGESNQVFPPMVGGTTKKDMESGRVASLTSGTEAQRTTLMKLSTLSTLWDYINRAMPWNAPKTLTVEEVYAVTAYVLHLGDILPPDFTLSNDNIAEVQKKLPNRNGTSTRHGLWLPAGKPDVRAASCMSNCLKAGAVKVASSIPDYARDAHGNLAEQNRLIGGVRGQVTLARAAGTGGIDPDAKPSELTLVKTLANKGACLSCHATDRKLVGPGFHDIAARYRADTKAEAYLAGKIKAGGQGVWGAVPMPPSALSDGDASLLAKWILKGAPE